MQQAKVLIQDEVGLHARPAAQFVKLAKQFQSIITVSHGDKKVNAKSLVLLLGLGLSHGSELIITAEGPDEAEAVQALASLVERDFMA